jgi:hypothetical protein
LGLEETRRPLKGVSDDDQIIAMNESLESLEETIFKEQES